MSAPDFHPSESDEAVFGPRRQAAEAQQESVELSDPPDPDDFGLVYEPGRHLIELVRELLQTHDVASMVASLQFAADAFEAELDGEIEETDPARMGQVGKDGRP